MEGKSVFQIILGAAILVSVCLAAPNDLFSSFFTPITKEVRIPGRVEVVRGPSYMVRGGPTHVFQGGPTHVIQGGPTHVIHGGPTHLVHGPPLVVGVGHVMHQPPPPPPPVFQPGASHQCICTPPSNCRQTQGLHRCSQGKVNFNNIGAEVCCQTADVIC